MQIGSVRLDEQFAVDKKEIDFAIRAPFKLEKTQRHDYFGLIDRYLIIHE
jgi:hypothetical protein